MKKIYHFLAFLVFSTGALQVLEAQEAWTKGYILTTSGEKIEGQIKYLLSRELNTVCYFQAEGGTQVKVYRPGEIQAFYFDKVKYASKSFDLGGEKPELCFAECWFESEKYVLYRYKQQYLVEDLAAGGEPIRFSAGEKGALNQSRDATERKNQSRLLALNQSLLSAAGVPTELLPTALPKIKDIRQNLARFHETKSIPYQYFQDLREEMRMSVGVVEAQYSPEPMTRLSDGAGGFYENTVVNSAMSMGLALPLTFSAHPSVQRLSLQVQPMLKHIRYQINYNRAPYDVYAFNFRSTLFQVPVLLSYRFTPASQKFHLQGRLGPNFWIGLKDGKNVNWIFENNLGRDTLVTVPIRYFGTTDSEVFVDLFGEIDLTLNLQNGRSVYLGIRGNAAPFKRDFQITPTGNFYRVISYPLSMVLGYRPRLKSGLDKIRHNQ
jgi:hypothetical protein